MLFAVIDAMTAATLVSSFATVAWCGHFNVDCVRYAFLCLAFGFVWAGLPIGPIAFAIAHFAPASAGSVKISGRMIASLLVAAVPVGAAIGLASQGQGP